MRLLSLALVAVPALAQVPVEKPPELAPLKQELELALKKGVRARAELEAAAPKTVDAKALARALATMDFVEGCSFGSFEKQYTCPDEHPASVSLTRTTAAGDLSFQLRTTAKDLQLTHTNFTVPPPTKTEVMKWNGDTYLMVTAYGEREYHRVLSFDDGVLVVKLTKDGKRGSKDPKWYHQVRIAVPRYFESDGK